MNNKDLQSLTEAYQSINEDDKLKALKSFKDNEAMEQRTEYLRNKIIDFFHQFDDFLAEIYDEDLRDKEYISWLRGALKGKISLSSEAKNNVDNIKGFVRVLEDAAEELKNTLEGTIEEDNKLEGLKQFVQKDKELNQFYNDIEIANRSLDKSLKVLKQNKDEIVSNMNSTIENLSDRYNEGSLSEGEAKEFERAMNLELLPDYLNDYAGQFKRILG
jgi:predicted transcriptional regulator